MGQLRGVLVNSWKIPQESLKAKVTSGNRAYEAGGWSRCHLHPGHVSPQSCHGTTDLQSHRPAQKGMRTSVGWARLLTDSILLNALPA